MLELMHIDVAEVRGEECRRYDRPRRHHWHGTPWLCEFGRNRTSKNHLREPGAGIPGAMESLTDRGSSSLSHSCKRKSFDIRLAQPAPSRQSEPAAEPTDMRNRPAPHARSRLAVTSSPNSEDWQRRISTPRSRPRFRSNRFSSSPVTRILSSMISRIRSGYCGRQPRISNVLCSAPITQSSARRWRVQAFK